MARHRRHRRGLTRAVVALTATAFSVARAEGDEAYGAYLAAQCAPCHGEAESPGSAPALRGRPASELRAALEAYRDGGRTGTTMRNVVAAYGDAEIAALVAHFAAQSEEGGTP